MKNRKIIIAHNSLQHSPKLYNELKSQGCDVELIVPYIYKSNRGLKYLNLISPKFISKLREKRGINEINLEGVKNVIIFEILKTGINFLPFNRYRTEYLQRKLDHYFDMFISFYLYFQNSNSIFISYPNVCRRSFNVAKNKGIQCVLDLPTMHHSAIEEILREEKNRYPELIDQLMNPINEFNDRLNSEMELADKIVIPSSTVERSFPKATYLRQKLEIIPYGSNFKVVAKDFQHNNVKPIKLIVIGQIQQRKGILYVLEAIDKLLKDGLPIQVTFCGNNYLLNHTKRTAANIAFKGFLNRKEIQKELNESQIIISGSLIEGFSLAIAEAISQGVVPVVTENCGADFIQDGKNGFLVPIRNSQAIYERVKFLIENQEILKEFQFALSPCLTHLSWSNYGIRWYKLLRELC